MFKYLPMEIIDKIVLMTQDINVAISLKSLMSTYAYDCMERRLLIYGNVQSGKTKEIIKYIKSTRGIKVLVIQNSLLVLEQYKKRFKAENVKFSVVSSETKELKSETHTLVVMNNSHRYKYFANLNVKRYILMLDEADQTVINCPLKGYKTVHITATPFFDKKIETKLYDRIITTEHKNTYKGFNDLDISTHVSQNDFIEQFLNEKEGMMLISTHSYVRDMQEIARQTTLKYKTIPVVLLCSEKTLYLNNKTYNIKKQSISKIIDSFSNHKHIIFIASRVANRGLSFVSSDYKRYLTYQIPQVHIKFTSFIQSLRILGIREKNPKLKVLIECNRRNIVTGSGNRFIEHTKKFLEFNVMDLKKPIS